ncbi:ribonuclease [Sphingomonas sp. KR1UV-12]|uniref:Ribonuclease n=1 Tax=Sphingomonas aurea TaxID=3063994 RepID=A0ABT9EJF7_9SPHN|nr:ribonuclease [Sphingomonas sp. KR1UV-12]MDP1027107.1 ribonuclease [Sphingomonas sp. KR1UV-12]
MAEWLYEAGIGEQRAALVDADDRILVAAIEPDDAGPLVGTVCAARLIELLPARRGRVTLADGGEAMLDTVPPGMTQGSALTVAITREPIVEPGRAKPARCVAADAAPAPGPDLLARIVATGHPVRTLRPHEPDRLEQAGWSEVLEEASGGEIAFSGGTLLLCPTPAMTLFDVDGAPPVDALALAAADAVAAAIVRHDIGGSIGIDFPTVQGKAIRQAIAAALDAGLPQPFERTAVNGFGFLQIVRPRPRPSLPERLRADPAAAAARAALRLIERSPAGASLHHRLPASAFRALTARPEWLTELARRTGVVHLLESM